LVISAAPGRLSHVGLVITCGRGFVPSPPEPAVDAGCDAGGDEEGVLGGELETGGSEDGAAEAGVLWALLDFGGVLGGGSAFFFQKSTNVGGSSAFGSTKV
jgi:hypothetical protein